MLRRLLNCLVLHRGIQLVHNVVAVRASSVGGRSRLVQIGSRVGGSRAIWLILCSGWVDGTARLCLGNW